MGILELSAKQSYKKRSSIDLIKMGLTRPYCRSGPPIPEGYEGNEVWKVWVGSAG